MRMCNWPVALSVTLSEYISQTRRPSVQVALPAYQPPEMLSAVRNELSSTGHAAEAADCWAIGVSTSASADSQLRSLNCPLSYNTATDEIICICAGCPVLHAGWKDALLCESRIHFQCCNHSRSFPWRGSLIWYLL